MRKFLSGTDLFSLVMLLRSGTSQALLLVEGSTDSLALSSHVDNSETRIVVGYGRESVEDAVYKSESRSVPNVVGLVDSDLESQMRPRGTGHSSPNIIRTEHYDLESDILFIPGLAERIVYSQADRTVVDDHIRVNSTRSVLSVVTKLAYTIGRLRLDSVRGRHGLYLRELPLDQFLDPLKPKFDEPRLAAAIFAKSKSTQLSKAQITHELKRIASLRRVDLDLCCGHDLLRVLAGALTLWWQTKATYESVARMLRATLSRADLMSMRIYGELDKWAKRNGKSVWMA